MRFESFDAIGARKIKAHLLTFEKNARRRRAGGRQRSPLVERLLMADPGGGAPCAANEYKAQQSHQKAGRSVPAFDSEDSQPPEIPTALSQPVNQGFFPAPAPLLVLSAQSALF